RDLEAVQARPAVQLLDSVADLFARNVTVAGKRNRPGQQLLIDRALLQAITGFARRIDVAAGESFDPFSEENMIGGRIQDLAEEGRGCRRDRICRQKGPQLWKWGLGRQAEV